MAAAVAAVFAVSCSSGSEIKVDVPKPTKGQVDTVSYLLGVHFGSIIKGDNFAKELSDLNLAEIKKGMEDFLKAKGNPYTDPKFHEQFKVDLNQMNDIIMDYLQKRSAYLSAVAEAKNKEFFEKNARNENVNTLPSGLQYVIIEEGSSEKIQLQDELLVNYKGTLLDNTVFDQGDSVSFPLTNVIKGWQEGLCLVGEGAKIKLFVPADLAYGPRATGIIEPNSALIFDVEVLKVTKPEVAEEAQPESAEVAKAE